MPTKPLPARPDLRHLKRQARDLLTDHRVGTLDACQRIREFHPRFRGATDAVISSSPLTLADAYLAIAREYGFPSWVRLKAHVETRGSSTLDRPHHKRIQDAVFRRAVELLDEGDGEGLRAHLRSHPGVVHQRVVFEGGNYFRNPALLEFIAENPVRHDSLPPNICEIARVILDAGGRADRAAVDSALALVCSGRVPRECGVQIALIDLLCDYGAGPDKAIRGALGHGEFDAADALIRRGATMDLVVSAATGNLEAARRALPTADPEQRHLALALAAQHGRTDLVALLLESGEDPDRYNPVGCHAHSTPLHQAALAGHFETVRLLVEHGARLDIMDIHHRGTPLEWAEYAGRGEVADYLRGAAVTRAPETRGV
jgi:hypothetical protein